MASPEWNKFLKTCFPTRQSRKALQLYFGPRLTTPGPEVLQNATKLRGSRS